MKLKELLKDCADKNSKTPKPHPQAPQPPSPHEDGKEHSPRKKPHKEKPHSKVIAIFPDMINEN